MLFKNPNSTRENPFNRIYRDEKFSNILQNKENLLNFPYFVDVELTNHCNLQCIFCGQQAMYRHKGFMSKELLKKIVDECAQFNTPLRFIRWGEPFLHPKIIDFCRYIKSKNLPLHITNNGLAIKEEQMKSLVDLKVDSIIFSFQGATKEQYEIMRNNNRYDELKKNILKMVEFRGNNQKPFIHISSTMTDESKEQIEEFVSFWGNIVDSVGVGKTNLSKLQLNQVKSSDARNNLENLRKKETIKKEYKPCPDIYQKIGIDWDGKVTCCSGDFDNFLVIGDLKDSPIQDIWNNSKELKTFRELLNKNMHKSLTLCSTCYHTYEKF